MDAQQAAMYQAQVQNAALANAALQQQLLYQQREAERAHQLSLPPGLRRPAAQPNISEAPGRALALLREHLTPEQRAMYERTQLFIVIGRSGRRYRIRASGSLVANVDVLGADDRPIHRLCAHIASLVGAPFADHILAQKLMLEASEDEFLRLANCHPAPAA